MSGKGSRAILLSIPVVLLALLGAWWGLSKPDAQPEEQARTSQPKPAAPAPQAAATPGPSSVKKMDGSRAWVPGTLYRYALLANQNLGFIKKQGVDNPPEMRFGVQGEWNVGVISVTEERIDARVNLVISNFTVAVNGNESVDPQARSKMITSLELPFFISMDKTGTVKLTHFDKQTDALTRGLHRSFVAASQFVVTGVPQDLWKTEEYDTTGLYQAEYERKGADSFSKRKKSYSHLTTLQGPEPVGPNLRIEVRADSSFELEKDLWPRAVQDTEHLVVDTGDKMPTPNYDFSMSLRLQKRLYDPSLFGSFKASQGLISGPMSSYSGYEQDPMDQYRQVLAGKNFDTLLKELHSLPKEELARDDARTRVLEQLRALFMLQPGEALKVPGAIREGMDPLAASPMLGALSAASTKESIQSLVDVSGDQSIPHDIRMDSVAALGMAGTPNRQGVDALRTLSHDPDAMLRDTATLGLGNAAYQMSDTDKGGADALVHELTTRYRSAATAEEQALVLRTLGNTRSPGTLPLIQEALGSPSPQVRQAAVEALRNVPTTDADQLLSQYLINDPAVEVRRAAVFACAFRPLPPLLPAITQSLRADKSDGVRADVINLLGSVRAVVPEAMTLLLWASQNDPNEDLRKMARMYIDTPATGPQASPATP